MSERQSSGTYVIDEDYTIVTFNKTAARIYPMLRRGDKCYHALMNGTEPCELCPVAQGIKGPRTYMDPIRRIYETVDAVEVPLTDGKNGHALIFSTVPDDDAEPDPGHRERILIVNESMDSRRNMMDMIGDRYEYLEADSTEEGLSLLGTFYKGISVILLCPESNGKTDFSFLNAVRIDALLSSIPVIVHSDHLTQDEVAKSLSLGAIEILAPPYDPLLTRSRIFNIIRMRNAASSLKAIERDELTGLYTKNAFYHHARAFMDADPDGVFRICVSDVDNFKMINSLYGDDVGDQVLTYLADYLSRRTLDGVCGRYSGDQFIVLVRETPMHNWSWVEDMIADIVANAPVPNLNIKLGFYNHIDTSLSITEICDRSLLAVKSVKHNYTSSYAVYGGGISQRHMMAQLYEARFMESIQKREFVLWYQPKMDPYRNKVVGAEALVRWKQADGTVLAPGEFLPVFEKDGLISRLDEYVFEEVCAFQRRWIEEGRTLLPVSVNLSRNSIYRKGVVDRYLDLAARYRVPVTSIPIEITESAAISSREIQPLANAFIQAGFELHMDDFGSGRSSLASLNVLHFRVAKIDKSLVDYIGDPQGDKVLKHTMALMDDLGLVILAEGVENETQRTFLMKNGCDEMQGYYYAKPLPEQDFIDWVADAFHQKV